MMKNIGLAIIGALSLLVGGCGDNEVTGTVNGHEIGPIETAVWFTYGSAAQGGANVVWLVDYGWTCDELKAFVDTNEVPATDPAGTLVAITQAGFWKWDEAVGEVPSMETGTYSIIKGPDSPASGTLVGRVDVYTVGPDAGDEDNSDSGSVTLTSYDEGAKTLGGNFEATLESGAEVSGRFSATWCDIQF